MVWFARRIFIDIYLTMFMSLTLAFFVLAERHPEHRRRYLLLAYVTTGLGVLTKGPVALALPVIVLLIWLALERRLADLRLMMIVPGTLVILAIVIPWYAAVYRENGWTYITQFFVTENLGRYTTAMTPGDRGLMFYVPVLLGDLFPWSPLVVVPLVQSLRAQAPVQGEGRTRRCVTSSARRMDCRLRRGVLAFAQQGGPLHLPNGRCAGSARRRCPLRDVHAAPLAMVNQAVHHGLRHLCHRRAGSVLDVWPDRRVLSDSWNRMVQRGARRDGRDRRLALDARAADQRSVRSRCRVRRPEHLFVSLILPVVELSSRCTACAHWRKARRREIG